jgi:hypothetical protein
MPDFVLDARYSIPVSENYGPVEYPVLYISTLPLIAEVVRARS